MSDPGANRIVGAFAELRAAGAKTLVPFVTAGHPDLTTTTALLREFEDRGVRVCELGIPFSDPVADGPVIQGSYNAALEAGTTSRKVFEMIRSYRDGGGRLGLVAMVSYSIVYRHGIERFMTEAKEAGFDGFIIPDLSLEEAGNVERLAGAQGMCNVMLVAPTTSPERRLRIAGHSSGFLYCISVKGITGERRRLPEDTIRAVGELRAHVETPICVGFGISNPQTVKGVCEVADGAIVGSAIVRRMQEAVECGAGSDRLVSRVGRFVGELLAPLV